MKPITLIAALMLLLSTNLSSQTACDTALAGITTNISMSGSCILHLDSTMADQLISNYSSSLSYEVTIFDMTQTDTVESPLRGDAIGETYMVKIVPKNCPDSLTTEAWSTVRIEDYLAPRLMCMTDTMDCMDFALSDPSGIDECDTYDIDILALTYENACDSMQLPGISTIATRTYRVTDASGNSSSCTDTTFIRRVEFDSIAFPRDTLLACSARDSFFDSNGDLIAPSLLLAPGTGTLNDQYVFGVPTLEGVSLYSGRFRGCRTRAYYKDFFVDSIKRYCEYTYMRRWTAYEWYCDAELSESMVQNITFKDTIDPTVDILVDTLFYDITTASCQISVPVDSLRQYIDASDNCTPVDLLEIDYTYPVRLSSASDSVIVLQDADTFLVQITIKDKCGKEIQDSLYMVATDRRAPVALCEGSVGVSISDANTNPLDISALNRGSYDDCSSTVTLTARKMQDTAYANHHLNFGCIDRDEEELAAILRVTDARGNYDECMTMINLTVDTSMIDCDTVASTSPTISKATVSGTITYVDGAPVGHIAVSMRSADMSETTETDDAGYYEVPNVVFSSAVDITPTKNDSPEQGISTRDLLLIQRHMLGIEDLPTAYQVIAGDANVDGRLSVHDIIELRQLILGRTIDLSHTDSYRFVPADMDFEEPMDPWAEGVVFGKTVSSYSGPSMAQDFVAIKIGDVDYSLLSAGTRSSQTVALEYEIIPMGQYFEMNVKASKNMSIDGLQGVISFDPQLMRLMKVGQGRLPLRGDHYSTDYVQDGKISFSWSDIHTAQIADGETMMSFTFERFADVEPIFHLGQEMSAEYYQDDMIYPLTLSREVEIADEFTLSRNVPNPWSEETSVEFTIPSAAPVTINVYDMSMSKLYSDSKNCEAGANTFKIKNEYLPGQGIYFYEIVYAGQVRVSKMTRL